MPLRREHCYACTSTVNKPDKVVSDGRVYHKLCLEQTLEFKKEVKSLRKSDEELGYVNALKKHWGLK
jgi:hypothetical protein